MKPEPTCGRQGRGDVRKLILTFLVAAAVLAGWTVAAQTGIEVRGVVSASPQEADEGYFALDQQTMIMARPGSPQHQWLLSRIGQRVVVTIESDADSQ